MKPNTIFPSTGNKISLCAVASLVGLAGTLLAGDENTPAQDLTARGVETQMDLPGSFHKYYGQNVNYYRDGERKVAKLDLDGDLNYDGTISNEDPADNGAFQNTPPGLVVGVGELSKLVLRLIPYRIDYQGDVVVTIEVAGINRSVASGTFESFEEEQAAVGRIRVWRDAAKSELLLDSGKSDKLVHEFVMDASKYPANLPGTVPRTFYVEGVRPSGAYSGDLRVLTTVTHRSHGVTAETYAEDRKRGIKTFRTTFDHMLFTVTPTPMKKDFINNNAEGVWIKP
ncbi:hypothetical protein HZ994_06625 [Akkermansiaceae bacterium]|nr:hypothetical protein HZ994_06625 [Akkermansiaceae bacterium]